MRILRTLLPATFVALALLIPGATTLAAPTSSIDVTLGPACQIKGSTDPGQKLTIVHTSRTRDPKGTYKVVGGERGEWAVASCGGASVKAGDRFVVKLRPAGTVVRTFTVPTLTLSINRVTDIAKGRVVADGLRTLTFGACDPYTCPTTLSLVITPDAQGRYSIQDPMSMDGRDQLQLDVIRGRTAARLFGTAPAVIVTRGRAGITGFAAPGSKVTVTFTRGTKVGTFTGKANAAGTFQGTVLRNGAKFRLAAGDRVRSSIASDLDFLAPAGTLSMAGGVVSGTCYPNEQVIVYSVAPDRSSNDLQITTATGDGTFSQAIALPSGNIVTVQCDPGEGDTLQLVAVAP